MKASPHPRQHERLQALASYEILDTEREQDFDDIANLAAAICDAPIAVINLIDAERQWFKAETGLGVRETPIATSICSHVILETDFVEIHDTLRDPRMQDNPLCCGETGLRFYAGALLRTAEGLPIGTLCVLDHAPRSLTPLQRDTLRVLAQQVMAQLDMRKALRTADILRREVDHRVKNSLQSLSAFARLQHRAFRSEEARRALSTMMTRIDAITRLHEQLYTLDEHQEVSLDAYVRRICDHLSGLAPDGVSLRAALDPVVVSAQQAVAVGTFVNEFVTNSFKHAFPDHRIGHVDVAVKRDATGRIRLACADDGVGLPQNPKEVPRGLGFDIGEVICAELDCDLDIRSEGAGMTAELVFESHRAVDPVLATGS